MQGGRGAEWSGIPGGKFSLGRLKPGSGYCVGAVVETRMGTSDEKGSGTAGGEDGWMGKSKGTLAGNGMRDVWVIGEGFFRGVGAAFNVSHINSHPDSEDMLMFAHWVQFQEQKVGFRTY